MKKVLVLGAGASLAYGYPLGGELRQRILAISSGTAKAAGIVRERHEEQDTLILDEFKSSFLRSQIYSIDAFLGRRPVYSEIGKKCIAAILLECERPKNLYREAADKDHWYQYLFNHLAQKDWDDLTFDDLAIVTFNYDRSLEHYLYVALQATYGVTTQAAAAKLESLRIVHVYGSLCEKLPVAKEYIQYNGQLDSNKIEAATKGLIVIPEGRTDSATLTKARTWLTNADAIGFLGFGFDPTNVERLAKDGACQLAIKRINATHVRRICGSRIGMYDAEMKKAFMALIQQPVHALEVNNFHDLNCTNTLRATLLLD